MANDINKVTLIGRLTRDSEIRYSQSGTAIVRFSLAVNENRKDGQTGEWSEIAHFFDVTYFGKGAEATSAYLTKGKQVAIDGKLTQDRWTDDQGNNRSAVKIIALSLQLLGGGQERQEQAQAPSGYQSGQYGGYAPQSPPQGQYAPPPPPQPAQPSFDGFGGSTAPKHYGPGPETFADDQIPF